MASATYELRKKALKKQNAATWCRDLKITPGTFSMAKKQRLSPTLAGCIATKLGKDTTKWIAIAAIETERKRVLRDQMMDMLEFMKI